MRSENRIHFFSPVDFPVGTEHGNFIKSEQENRNISGFKPDLHPVPVPDINIWPEYVSI